MSFLMPFYIAGLAALSLPILFHLIRRAPKGQRPFSSLMFLRPSPPRLTRRSRLDQLLLLALRALALCLLALAFARPFLREVAELDLASGRGRRVAVVVDTSGSMRRGDAWTRARRRVDAALQRLGPTDQVALFTFDTRLRALVDFEEEVGGTPARKAELVRSRLKQVAPGWAATDLGAALVAVADALEGFNDTRELDAALEIVLVSDLQTGSRLDALQAYEWPAGVRLTIEAIETPDTTNAGVTLLPVSEALDGPAPYRARVVNDEESGRERFQLHWTRPDGTTVGDALGVYAPPGESRVIPAPLPEAGASADRVVLSGDDHAFDNTFYFVPRQLEDVTVAYVGTDAADDPAAMGYYLAHAFNASGRYDVTIAQSAPGEPLEPGLERTARLIVVTGAADEQLRRQLRGYMSAGGTVLYVLRDAASAGAVDAILNPDGVPGRDRLDAREAPVDDYAMLSEIDFAHPLFASFADPRFGDFTKIRFWKHRRLTLPKGSSGKVLARFDDGDPALLEHRHGDGRLLVLTSGWHPSDSQLALSTKFVPLLGGMLEASGAAGLDGRFYEVGETIPLNRTIDEPASPAPPPASRSPASPGQPQAPASSRTPAVIKPDGSEVKLPRGAAAFTETHEPGVYRLLSGRGEGRFAVNVAPDESRTAPMEAERLERFGIPLGAQAAESPERRQQLRDLELEGRQKLWRWLIAGALGVLILETWLAGYLSRPRRELEEDSTRGEDSA